MTTAIAGRSPEGILPSRRRLTYEEVIDYIARDPDKVKYPDRQAKFLRNSFQLSFLDAQNLETMQEQQVKARRFEAAQIALHDAAVENASSVIMERARKQPRPTPLANPQPKVNPVSRIVWKAGKLGLQGSLKVGTG